MRNFKAALFALIFVIAGFLLSNYIVKQLFSDQMADEKWLPADGQVTSSYVSNFESDGTTMYEHIMAYEYKVDNHVYYGPDGNGVRSSSSSPGGAEKKVEKYPEGAALTVYYNPKQHDISRLTERPSFFVYFFYYFPYLFLIIGVVVLIKTAKMLMQNSKRTYA
jgi:hypothetical protein